MAARQPSIRWGRYWIFFSLRLTMRTRPFQVGGGEVDHGPLEQRPDSPQSVCHSAWIVGRSGAGTPVIGREGLLRLVEWAGRLRARGPGGGAPGTARAGIFSR